MVDRSFLLRGLAHASAAVGIVAVSSACNGFGKDEPVPPYEVMIRVDSDPGVPLPGAVVVRNGKDIVATGADGRAKLQLTGSDGDTSDFMVRCPADFASPVKPISITIRRLSGGSALPEFTTNCPPNVRRVVVAIRADGGPSLPITYLGKSVGKTDASGAAHLLLAMKPGDQFQLGLDTSGPGLERLRPESPAKVFVVKDADDIQTFDMKFTMEPIKRAPPKKKILPIRIDPKHAE